jgi:pimeloyl-ACP methyl ester carboxylesterase
MRALTTVIVLIFVTAIPLSTAVADALPGFESTAPFHEQTRWSRLDSGVRVFVSAPADLRAGRPRRLVLYATPNGSTIEQTLGCAAATGRDWRYDIQHVAAQVRRLRELDATQDILLAVVQAPRLSWPAFRAEHSDAGEIITGLVDALVRELLCDRVVLTGHSGGGSFTFGYLNAVDALPPLIDRVVLLDSNYAYSDDDRHGDKLLAWLNGDPVRRLVVIAYDDREIVYNGRKVVGPDGGTFRASQRMLTRFRRDVALTEETLGPFAHTRSASGQIEFFIHPNPDNRILHTALVGDMNGLLHGLTLGTDLAGKWGEFGGSRAYTNWIQAEPFIEPATRPLQLPPDLPVVRLSLPERPADAQTGTAFRDRIAALPLAEREAAAVAEITAGNIPAFLRQLKPVPLEFTDDSGTEHSGVCFVTPDYLAIGSDDDFFRLPLTPQSAVTIADAAGGTLLTARVSDAVWRAADLRLEPRPLTENRESVATFWQHHQAIEEQLVGSERGLLVAGVKKDIVWTNRLREKPHKVAIYGWHYPDGRPIQPLYVGHRDRYVDYSHGLRLLHSDMLLDGRITKVVDVLQDPHLCGLLSDEGPLDEVELPSAAVWER